MNKHYTAEQTSQLVLRKTIIRLEHHDIYKGGAHSETSENLFYSQEEHVLRGSETLCP